MPKRSLLLLIGGILCLPATYYSTREGSLALSAAVAAAIAIVSTLAVAWSQPPHTTLLRGLGLFVAGVVVSEAAFFAYYYFDYGRTDPKLSVGIAVAFTEAAALAMLGALAVSLVWFVMRLVHAPQRHLTNR